MAINPYVARQPSPGGGPQGLADVLERVLDKGLVIVGDIQVSLLDIELLTLKVRLLVASADTAQQMGIDWWQHDSFLSSKARELEEENVNLRARLERLEAAVGGQEQLAADDSPATQGQQEGAEQNDER
ncbi:MAG: gas vesicle protein [Actinomycetota bacterium]|nr:gas vesicle protein [Actinomycetota bacterium]